MKRLLTFLVILALIGYLSFKGAVWWLADKQVAAAQQAVEDIGVIERGGIRSGVQGAVALINGGYEDFRLSQPIQFGRLMFEAGSPIALVSALIDPANMPSQWSVQGEGIEMSFDDALFRNWVTASEEEQDPALFAPVCGSDPRQLLGSGDLLKLGVTGLFGEALVRQEVDSLYAEVTTAETGSIELLWPGARFQPTDPGAVFASTDQPLQLSIRDGGLMRRLSAYCARESGMSVEDWTAYVLQSFDQALLAHGYAASKQLLALYRQWLNEGGELTVTLNPSQPLLGVPIRTQNDAPAAQDAVITPWVLYNEAQVPEVFLTAVEPETEAMPVEAVEPVAPVTEPDGSGWELSDKTLAADLIGQTVKVTLENGNVVEGRLSGVDEKRMEVVRLVDGGELAYPIAIRLIATFEVWRRGQPFQILNPES